MDLCNKPESQGKDLALLYGFLDISHVIKLMNKGGDLGQIDNMALESTLQSLADHKISYTTEDLSAAYKAQVGRQTERTVVNEGM